MLHLIFGFLEWFESDNSAQPHLAPLLLVPVTIEKGNSDRTSGTFTYKITYSSADQIEQNLSLREKLKRDFGLDLPELADEETPETLLSEVSRNPRREAALAASTAGHTGIGLLRKASHVQRLGPEELAEGS